MPLAPRAQRRCVGARVSQFDMRKGGFVFGSYFLHKNFQDENRNGCVTRVASWTDVSLDDVSEIGIILAIYIEIKILLAGWIGGLERCQIESVTVTRNYD